ncbi:MAG: cytochrome P460 family protein [Pseudomonadales bacterium]
MKLAASTGVGMVGLVLALGQGTGDVQAGEHDLPEPDAEAVWNYLNEANYEQEWQLWPGTQARYEGTEPHGMLLTTYVNSAAYEALTEFPGQMPRGSIIVKENYTPDEELAAVTVMYKAEQGYNPEHNDWYWLKRQVDGTVDATGRAEGCQACHGVSDKDYLRTPLPGR